MEDKQTKALDILTPSFLDNGSVNYVVGNTRRRVRQLMSYSYVSCLKKGQIVFHESDQAVMLYMQSDASNSSLRVIWEEIKLVVLGIGWRRLIKVLRREAYIAKNRCKDPHLYLWFIGTHPAFQRRGMGIDLINKLITLSNQMGRLICLETSNPKNLPFYRRLGFEIYHESNPAELGYTLWFMKRVP